MPFTLAEFAKIEKDHLRKSVLDTFLEFAPIMQKIPWETIGALATTIVRYQDLPSIGFRKINEGYPEGIGHLEQRVENISLMGVYMDCDKAIARAKNTIANAREITQKMALKGVAYKFQDKFINGNPATDPEEFKGIKERIDDLKAEGFDKQYIDNDGTRTGSVRDAGILKTGEEQNFLDKLHKLLYAIKGHKPDFLLMNSTMLLAVSSVLRRVGLMDTTKDMFDRRVELFYGVPMLDIGVMADQKTDIITTTEDPDGIFSTELSTSIYAVKFGIGEYLWGIQEYALEVEDKGLLKDKPVYRTELDWPLGLAVADPYSIARLYNIFPDDTSAS